MLSSGRQVADLLKWLLLPGDTGSAIIHAEKYFKFLVRMCEKFQRVIMVIGNNDFKGPHIQGKHKPLNDGIAAG